MLHSVHRASVEVGALGLPGTLMAPQNVFATVIFAHGSGSSRLSPRNIAVAEHLNRHGMATLLFDLLHAREEAVRNRANVFDIDLLASRLSAAVRWLDGNDALGRLPVGFFGASTGAAAALVSASQLATRIGAVVSRGGRPDLAGEALPKVRAPTLLIVGGNDHPVIELNERAFRRLECHKTMTIIPGATHLFEEPGAMQHVVRMASGWFEYHLGVDGL